MFHRSRKRMRAGEEENDLGGCAQGEREREGKDEVSDEVEEQQQKHLLYQPIDVFVLEVWSNSEEPLVLPKERTVRSGWGGSEHCTSG